MAIVWRVLAQVGFERRRLTLLVQVDFVELQDYSNFAKDKVGAAITFQNFYVCSWLCLDIKKARSEILAAWYYFPYL